VKRVVVLALLLAAGAGTLAVAGDQQAQTPGVVEVEKLKDNLFVFRGTGGGANTAVFITGTGVVVVDTKNPGWGQPILDKIKELTPKPVTTIINTHTHGDHVSGNVEFPATVDVVTHVNTKANMEKMVTATGISQGIRGFQPRVPDLDAKRPESGEERRRCRLELEHAGQVHGIHGAATHAAQGEHPGHVRRAAEAVSVGGLTACHTVRATRPC
jgi:glyoxylase-like metal-dependent hydrolase (beta-lactamase superfamily II)